MKLLKIFCISFTIIFIFIFVILLAGVVIEKEKEIERCNNINGCEKYLCKMELYDKYNNKLDKILIREDYIICKEYEK